MTTYLNTAYQTLKPHAIDLINPFSSKIKAASIVTALASNYLFNISYTYSCLIGFLTFGSLKIYKFKKDRDLKFETTSLAAKKRKLDDENAIATLHSQVMKAFLSNDKDYIIKVLASKEGDDLFDDKKQIVDACNYFNIKSIILPTIWRRFAAESAYKDRLEVLIRLLPKDKRVLFQD